eukprot:CAMPEP_0206224326 /NCGR_PEP_ID=MMETSP0047_2-20121206/6965_1 /ASSEMBLY_ACC=CAM_ASM_000192 /TAXON_ID=195065 /ORGANISM="Chroomonas mesostigmatica_cf, Strain CCMP1168" /LENGTH=247 /DNA_ID=CAMNT_0053647273 /DNA_START=26 /DNA_END=769 /DNA_ORIENTATION=+
MMVRDIEGNEPVLKKDNRRQGRMTDPSDPVYVSLGGIDKEGLLEREINSKPVNVRRALKASESEEPDYHIALQAEERSLEDKQIDRAFACIDFEKSGKIAYADFAQSLNRIGIAVSGKQVVEVARKLDAEKKGKVDYGKLPQMLYNAKIRGDTAKGFTRVGTTAHLAVTEMKKDQDLAPKLLMLRDKLYRKHEKTYHAFSTFDQSHTGTISMDEFIQSVANLNVGIDKATTAKIAKKIDLNSDGVIN